MSGRFGCCDTCAFRDTDACEECEDADLYELDEDLIGEGTEDRVLEAA